jgi:hypothetical protein
VTRIRHDEGNVVVEFIGITVALLIPLSIISSSCIQVANAYLSTEVSARTAARAFVISSNDTVGTRAAKLAAGTTSQDLNSRGGSPTTRITCTKNPCLTPGGFVTVKVTKEVKLNLPRTFESRSIFVSSQHTAVVDELRTL